MEGFWFRQSRHSSVEKFYAWHYWSSSSMAPLLSVWYRTHIAKVSLYSCSSSCFQIRSGVPQGSILGPLLFLIYANDMFSVVSPTKLLLFADDSQCFHRINNPSDCCLLQRDLDNLSDWADRCGMRFNTSKCAYMIFGLESHGYNYVMNSSVIPNVVEYKDVGVMLTPHHHCLFPPTLITSLLKPIVC